MKSFLKIICVVVFPGLLHAQLAWDNTFAEIKPSVTDTNASASYAFRNTGKSPVIVKKVTTSCSCTTATLGTNTFLPGQRGELKVWFDFGQRSGKQEKTILVQTDDPQKSSTMLVLKVWIPELLKLEPAVVLWTLNGKLEPKVVRLLATGDAVNIREVKPGSGNYTCKLKTITEGREYELTLIPKELSKPGYTAIQVFIDKPVKKTMTIVAGVR